MSTSAPRGPLERPKAGTRISPLPPLPPWVYRRPRSRDLPFPLEEPDCRLYERGRHCLWQGVRALGLQPGDEVLAPAYHHGSEIEALVRADLACRFYEATPTLEPDGSELEAMLGPRVRALYLIHYLGFPQDAAKWRAWCDERELFLIEDAAQSWLATLDSRPLGSFGDLSIFCLYKSFGVPDGGALLCTAAPPPGQGEAALGGIRLLEGHVAWSASRSRALARLLTRLTSALPRRPDSPDRDFDLGDPHRPPSRATEYLLPRIAETAAAGRRRANYQVLLGELAELVPVPFNRLDPGAAPFHFPIETEDKALLLEKLASHSVNATNLWSVPHSSLPADRFPGAATRRERTVGLPVHQELRSGDLARMVKVVRGRMA